MTGITEHLTSVREPPGKPLLRALAGITQATPPLWMMRQAGRYLPEYRALRKRANGFLALCYTPELAAEVTMQPVHRFHFDAAIIFADILLLAQALGVELSFDEGTGPRLSPVRSGGDIEKLRPNTAIHDTLAPVYETIRMVADDLPQGVTMIGFAGAPWTVATYMIAGRGEAEQKTARRFMEQCPHAFEQLMERLTEATIDYLDQQARAGAEVLKLFDSWAGSLDGAAFDRFVTAPTSRIVTALKSRHPDIPVIVFPRHAGTSYAKFVATVAADCVALDSTVDPVWAARELQPRGCVQGNLDPRCLVTGGDGLVRQTRHILESLRHGPFIFNLGHGITPDAKTHHIERLIDIVRQS